MTEPGPLQPLSPLQVAMLRVSLDGCSGENVEQAEMDFADGVSMAEVESAWISTVRRTGILNRGFLISDGEPCGTIALATVTPLWKLEEQPASWLDWLAADRLQSLPLNGGQPWRAVLWPEMRKLVWTFHHALLDGRSIAAIIRSFQANLDGNAPPVDLGLAVAAMPTRNEIAAALEFHRSEFSAVKPCEPEFPSDEDGVPACVQSTLGVEMVARLESAAKRMEVTAATVLTWAWGQVIASAAGVKAAAVGQVRSGPPTPGLAGFTMNIVPLVIDRAQPGKVTSVLQDFRNQLLKLREIESVSPQDLTSGVFSEAGGPWPGGGVMIQRGDLSHQVGLTQVIKGLTLHEQSGERLLASAWIHPELLMEVVVNGHPFGVRAAQSLLDHWVQIVRAIADAASDDPQTLCALPSKGLAELTTLENGGAPTAHLHLAQAWNESLVRFASHTALWTPESRLTFAELGAQVSHLAALLIEAGIKSGQAVASILRDRKYLALVLLALARTGAVNVPLDPALPRNRLRMIIDDADPRLVLIDTQEDRGMFTQPSIVVEGAVGKTCTAELPDDPRATLSILYTSGSTGTPKGVLMVHGGVTNEALGIANLVGIGTGDRLLQFASLGFDASLEELLASLLSGATLVPRPENLSTDLDEFQSFIRSAGITILDLSTAHWAAWCAWMVSGKEQVPDNVRAVIIGGERASAAAIKNWFTAGGRQHLLVNTYGPTEASIVATAELIHGEWNEPGDPAIGRPLPGVLARVCDASGNVMPPGAAGELWLGGVGVGDGYWRDPELTTASFQSAEGVRWYRTGDRACWDQTGKLRFLGRRDDQLKIRGNRVEPNEVIRVLESFPGVSTAHVGAVPGHHGSVLLAGWIRWDEPPADGWPGLLDAHAAGHLPIASIPTRWAAVDDFKLTERGKLDRRSLTTPHLTASIQPTSGPPATLTEKRLVGIWSDLLGLETINRDESFFEMGGHSLAALQLFASIAREWQVRIPMAVLIQAPTPRLLGKVIDREVNADLTPRHARSVIIPIRAEGHLIPLFCIHGGDGGVFFYRDLANEFPPGRPILAIESPALAADGRVRSVSVEDTARTYLAALRLHQHHGPYYLAGYSHGGLLVFEMARQLLAVGETVAFAGLFDTMNPTAPIRSYHFMERMKVFWGTLNHLTCSRRVIALMARAHQGLRTHRRVKRERWLARNAGITEPHSGMRMLQVREAHWDSMLLYQPLVLDCHVTLFKSRVPDDKFLVPEDNGWGALAKSLEIVLVSGEHLAIFSPEHVSQLAVEISGRIPDEAGSIS